MAGAADIAYRKWKAYGNNYFTLKTNFAGKTYVMEGLLQDLPGLSFSAEWGNAPAADIGEKLDELLNNDMLNFLGSYGEGGGKMQAMDAMTSRMYKNCTMPTFDLKFRCYPGQKIGAYVLSSAKEWMLFLGLATPPNSDCGFSLKNLGSQLNSALDGAKAIFESLASERKKEEKETKAQENAKNVNDLTGRDYNVNTQKEDVEKQTILQGLDKDKTDSNEIKQTLDTMNKQIEETNKDTKDRATKADMHKTYGANLFQLTIYPFIFKSPITVYISSWTVMPSREWNNQVGDHYYYDFTISCAFDQLPSASTFFSSICKPE